MRLEIEPIVSPPTFSTDQSAVSAAPAADVEQMLKAAISAAQNGDRNTARVLLFKVTDAEPSNVDAWLWLASISEYPEELLGFLVRVLEIDPQNERARQWDRATRSLLAKTFVQRGLDASSDGQREMAANCFDEALEYDLSCETAWLGKSQVCDSPEEKELCLARVLNINPNNRDAQRALEEITSNRSAAKLNAARVAAFAGDTSAAQQTLDSILASEPDNVHALKLGSELSSSLIAKLEAYKHILRVAPDDAFARHAYDYLANEQGQAEAATFEPEAAEPQPETAAFETVVDEHEPELSELDAFPVETSEPIDLLQLSSELADYTPDPDPVSFENAVFEASEPEVQDQPEPETAQQFESVAEPVMSDTTPCAFCGGDLDPQAFSCDSCHAVLSMSDIETLFSNSTADTETIQDAVTRMEAEWNLREFSEAELTVLGLGHFNLHNFEQGLAYLHEASSLNANNVILAGQVNALAIRLDELRRQEENREALPKGKTILVVDDSATVRKLISSKLEKCGHNVVCAVDGVDAMEVIETVVPDLVLLDIAMPRMDGYSVCKLIRANESLKNVPVVMISGKDGFFDKVRGRMAGTTGYITKPFGPETLMRALDTYLIPEAQTDDFADMDEVQFYEA